MSAVSVGEGALLPTPFDKTAWLDRVCGKRADGLELICCRGHNFGDGLRKGRGQGQDVGCRTQYREKRTSETFHLVLSRPSRTRNKVALIQA